MYSTCTPLSKTIINDPSIDKNNKYKYMMLYLNSTTTYELCTTIDRYLQDKGMKYLKEKNINLVVGWGCFFYQSFTNIGIY